MSTIKNKTNSLILFYFGYVFFIVSDMCKQVEFIKTYNRYISLFGYLLIAIYLLFNYKKFFSMNKNTLLLITIGILISLIGFYFSRNFTIIRVILLSLSIMTMSFDSFVKNDLAIKLVIICTLIISSLLGIIDNKIIYREDLTKRYSLGFTHPNILSMYLAVITFELSYLLLKNRERVNNLNKCIILLIIPMMIIFLYCVTDTKTIIYVLIAFHVFIVIYLLLYKYLKKILENKIIKNIIIRTFLVISLILIATIVLAYVHPEYITIFDNIFSYRYSYYMTFLNNLDINGLGTVIPDSINNAVLDNMYLKLFLNGGVIFWSVYYILFRLSLNKAYKVENYLLLSILVIMCFIGFVETNVIMPTLNIFILYCFSNYFEEHDRKGGKNERVD